MSGLFNTHADTTMKEPLYIKQPPCHPFNERVHGMVPNVTSVMAFPFPTSLTETPDKVFQGTYAQGASGWSELNPHYPHKDKVAAILHMIAVAVQMKNNGCPIFKDSSSRKNEAMLSYIRHAEGRAEIEDIQLLNNHDVCRQDYFTDLKAAEVLRAILAGTFNENIPGRQEQVNTDNDVIQDGNNVDIRRGGRRRARPRQRNDDDDEQEADPMSETDAAILAVIKDALAAAYQGDDEDEEEEEEDEEGDNERRQEHRKKNHITEKIKVLVVRMTRPVYEKDGKIPKTPKKNALGKEVMEDAGFVVFMLVMDPFYSMGRAFRELIEMSSEHRASAMGIGNRDAMEGGRAYDEDGGDGGGGASRMKGGKGRGRPAGPGPSRLLQAFPWLVDDEHAQNMLLKMDMDMYMETASYFTGNTSLVGEHRYAYKARGMDHPGTVRDPTPLHPLNVFTPERALEIMSMFGVKDDQCALRRFRGADALFDQGDGGVGRTWRFPPRDTFYYPIEAWVWAERGKAGLSRQLFPWIEVPVELAKLARSMGGDGQLVTYKHDPASDLIGKAYSEARCKADVGVITILPLIPYDPHKMLRQNTVWQMAQQHQKIIGDIVAPRDPENMQDEYKQYCFKVNKMRAVFLRLAQQALVPGGAGLASSVEHILSFMSREVSKVSTYLPQLTMDPEETHPEVLEMDAFAHYMIREATYLRNQLFVVGPSRQWQIAHYGSKDAYSMTNLSVHFALISRGMSQAGKSWVNMSATIHSSVPGTVQTMLESSNRAFNTHDDFTHAILFKDELEQIYVSGKAAENDKSGKAERAKSMMTDQKATYAVLTFVDQANGRQRRVSENIETLFHAVLICCTNKRIDSSEEAIASRFLSFVITRPEVDIFEFLDIKSKTNDLDAQKKRDFIHMLRVKQCLLAMTQILIDVAALPEPSMDAYNMITTRMTAYFKQNGLEPESLVRASQIIARLARIYTILNAIIQVFDVPGALHGGAVFRMDMLMDLIPYLYCTKQVTIFTMTQVGEIYYRPLQLMVLSTMFKMADFKYVKGRTLEEYVRGDTLKQIRWKQEKGPNDSLLYDFNYIMIEGDFKSKVLKMVANNTQPRISENDVASEIKSLCDLKVTTKPLETRSVEAVSGMLQHEVAKMELPRKPYTVQLPMVTHEWKGEKLYIAVEALNSFKEDMIVEAFLRCIHDGFRPQRFLLGVNYSAPNPVALAKAQEEEQRQREECKARNVQYQPDQSKPEIPDYTYTSVYKTLTVNAYTKMTYSMGPLFLETDPSYITPVASEIIKGPRLNPDTNEDYETSTTKRSAPVVAFADDLDDIAYRRHHYRVGIPGSHADSEATQTAVYTRIRQAALDADRMIAYHQELGDNADRSMPKRPRAIQSILLEYPEEMIADENQRLLQESRARAFDEIEINKKAILDRQEAAYKTMSAEDKKKHGIPTAIVSTDFLSGGRFAKATSAELRKLREDSVILQIEWEAKKGGKQLTKEQLDAVKSKAIIPVSETALNAEKTRASRRAKARGPRTDVMQQIDNKKRKNECAEVTHRLLHVPSSSLAIEFQVQQQQQQQGDGGGSILDVDNTMSPVFDNNPNNSLQMGLVAKGGVLSKGPVNTGPLPKKKPVPIATSKSNSYRPPEGFE